MNYLYKGSDKTKFEHEIELHLAEALDTPNVKEFLSSHGDPVLFGGAVRDILSGETPNDFDIICAPQTRESLAQALVKKGFTFVPKAGSDLQKENLKFRVLRFERKNEKDEPIQVDIIGIARELLPKDKAPHESTQRDVKESIIKMISNVDIVACACAYSPVGGLLEFIPGAIDQAKKKIIETRKDNLLHHPDRANDRIQKLKSRGWTQKALPKTKITPDLEMGI